MITKIKLIDYIDKEEEKKKKLLGSQFGGGWGISDLVKSEKETEEEKPFKIAKIKPITEPVEVPSYWGISELDKPEQMGKIQKGIISVFGTWEAKKRAMPELQNVEDFGNEVFKQGDRRNQIAYIHEALTGVSREETLKEMEANFEKFKNINPDIDERTWKEYYKEEGLWKTLITGPSKGKYDEAIKLRNQLIDIAQKVAEPGKDIIGQLGWSGMVVLMGTQLTSALYSGGLRVKDKMVAGENLKAAVERAKKAYIPKTGKFKSTLSNNDLAVANRLKDIYRVTGGKIENIGLVKDWGVTEKGFKIPQVTFLYAGLPADEIAKSIVEVGKVTADMVKGLDPVKVSQITQVLLNTSPALASEFLKAVEKPEEIFKVKPEAPIKPPIKPIEEKIEEKGRIPEILKAKPKVPVVPEITEKGIVPVTIEEAKEILKVDPKKPSVAKDMLVKQMVAKKVSLAEIEAVRGEKIDVTKPKDIIIALRDIKAVKKKEIEEPTPKAEVKEPWQMTKKEYIGDTAYIESAKNEHIQSVVEALREGKPVPAEVLADYPELKAKIKPPAIPEELKVGVKVKFKKFYADISEGQEAEITKKYTTPKGETLLNLYFGENLTGQKIIRKGVPLDIVEISKAPPKPPTIPVEPAVVEAPAPVAEKVIPAPAKAEVKVEPKIELASPAQINKAYSIAKSKAMISEAGKLKPQFRKIAEIFTGVKYIEKMTPEEAEMFIDMLSRLPEPKYVGGKLVAPSIPRTMKLTTEGFFQKKYGEPTPIWLLTDQTYYATKLGIKPLVEPFERGKQKFDLEFRKSSNLIDRMVNKLNQVAKTSMGDRIKSKIKNVPTKAESKMAGLVNEYETTPPGLSPKEEDIFKYFRNLSKDIWRRENEVREKVDLPPIKYKTAYFRHTADAMAKEMLEGKYPFPQGIKYWSEKMVGKKIFNPMEFHRRLSDDLIDLWSKDIRAVTKAMLWNGLKEIHLAQPAKFLSEQLNAISKDLPEYKNLTPREQAVYDQTRVMPASTKKWLINYVNQVIKGQETELDASLNRIVTKSGLKGIFDKVLSPFGRSVGRKPITNIASLSGRMVISGVMGWVPRQIIRNAFQQVQNLALYGVEATIKSFLPASIDKNLKGMLNESLFMKSYTGFEELPVDLMGKLEKIWLQPYGIVAVNNAKQGMKAAYWNILELIKNPKFKKHAWADPQRTKDTPKGFLYPSEKEKLLREMEFGSSCTQYQYIPMGMPGIFRYKALVPATRLQSWWMNYFTKFLEEARYRALKGRPSWSGEDGPTLPWSRRVNFLKYIIIGGAILTSLGYRKSFLLGVAPTYLSPAVQVALGFYNYATATEDWQKKRALNQIYYSWKAFIPGSLAWRDFLAVWNGEKDLEEILFYGKKEEKKPEAITIGKPSISKISIPKINKIKINKISKYRR